MRLFELIQPSDSYSDAWKRATSKGLPMDRESRMARAEAMGFDTSQVYYHGTNKDFAEFLPGLNAATGFGLYFTTNKSYATGFSMRDSKEGSAIYPVFLKLGKSIILTDVSRSLAISKAAYAGNLSFMDVSSAFLDAAAVRELQVNGYDSIINYVSDEIVVFNANQVRSIYAEFDPAKAASGQLSESRVTPCIVVDVQPAYTRIFDEPSGTSWVEKMMVFLNRQRGPILMFVNAEQDRLTEDTIEGIRYYWEEKGFDPNNWDRVRIVDKGFGFFRGWMDQDVPDDAIIKTIRLMYQNKVYDSRELFGGEDSDDYAINMEMGLGVPEEVITDSISVEWASVAQLKRFSGSYIMGGGRNECLREVELLMNAFNIKYKRIDDFIYE